jgi:hypothetical protein
MQISTLKKRNFEKPFRYPSMYVIGPKITFWEKFFGDISLKKLVSTYTKSSQKCSNYEILAKIEEKEAKFFSKIYQGHLRI